MSFCRRALLSLNIPAILSSFEPVVAGALHLMGQRARSFPWWLLGKQTGCWLIYKVASASLLVTISGMCLTRDIYSLVNVANLVYLGILLRDCMHVFELHAFFVICNLNK